MEQYKVFVINPGSTSTKIGLFYGDKCVFSKTVQHEAKELARFKTIKEQLPYRREVIQKVLDDYDLDLSDIDAISARGSGLFPLIGGVYRINDIMLDHSGRCANGFQHPATIGSLLAHEFAVKYGKPDFVVNPPDTDELCDLARMTGIKGVYRTVHMHALNLKQTAIKHSEITGREYKKSRYIVCHIGGGISVSAHENGMMIDGNDIAGGEGPMTPTRCGSIPLSSFLSYAEGKRIEDIKALYSKNGGFISHLGTSDALEVQERIKNGDKTAERVWNAMIYQITKSIGAMGSVLKGNVDAILLGGALVHSEDLVKKITEACSYIAPVYAYPGEFELEALAMGAERVLSGQEEPLTYTGIPRWSGFDD